MKVRFYYARMLWCQIARMLKVIYYKIEKYYLIKKSLKVRQKKKKTLRLLIFNIM